MYTAIDILDRIKGFSAKTPILYETGGEWFAPGEVAAYGGGKIDGNTKEIVLCADGGKFQIRVGRLSRALLDASADTVLAVKRPSGNYSYVEYIGSMEYKGKKVVVLSDEAYPAK